MPKSTQQVSHRAGLCLQEAWTLRHALIHWAQHLLTADKDFPPFLPRAMTSSLTCHRHVFQGPLFLPGSWSRISWCLGGPSDLIPLLASRAGPFPSPAHLHSPVHMIWLPRHCFPPAVTGKDPLHPGWLPGLWPSPPGQEVWGLWKLDATTCSPRSSSLCWPGMWPRPARLAKESGFSHFQMLASNSNS